MTEVSKSEHEEKPDCSPWWHTIPITCIGNFKKSAHKLSNPLDGCTTGTTRKALA